MSPPGVLSSADEFYETPAGGGRGLRPGRDRAPHFKLQACLKKAVAM